jgi:hypothetical protein
VNDVHASVRPFACTQCDRTFKRNEDLKSHTASSHGVAPAQPVYACLEKGCREQFTTREALLAHGASHSTPGASVHSTATTSGQSEPATDPATDNARTSATTVSTSALAEAASRETGGRKRAPAATAGTAAKTARIYNTKQLLEAANNDMLVLHGDHVDAVVDGKLVGFERRDSVLVGVEHSLFDTDDNSAVEKKFLSLTGDRGAGGDACCEHNCGDCDALLDHHHDAHCDHLALTHNDHSDYLIGHHLQCSVDQSTLHLSRVAKNDVGAFAGNDDWLALFAAEDVNN